MCAGAGRERTCLMLRVAHNPIDARSTDRRKSARGLGATLMLAACCFGLRAELRGQDRPPGGIEAGGVAVTLESVTLDRLLRDRAELLAVVEITPAMNAVLRGVRFRGMRLDEKTPVYIEPLGGEFVFERGKPLLLPHARISVFYSDFPTPAVMDGMLDRHNVRVTGEVWADLDMSLLGKLAKRDLHPVAALHMDQNVPFDEAAVDGPTQLGVGALALAQRALGTSVSLLDRVAGVRITTESGLPGARMIAPVVVVRTTYQMNGKDGASTNSCVRLGFWVDERHVLVPAEVLEPWAYSVRTAAALDRGGTSVDPATVDTEVFSAASSAGDAGERGWSRARGDFLVVERGHPERIRLLMPDGRAVTVLERESAGNFALLEFGHTAVTPVMRLLPGAEAGDMTVLRRSTADGRPLRLLDLGRGEPGTPLQMPRPVDEAIFGSPVMLDGSVTGMIVGEKTVVPLALAAPEHAGQGRGAAALKRGPEL